MKKIVLFVEGEGEADAAPLLLKKLINEQPELWEILSVEPSPFRVGEVNRLLKADNWHRKLKAATLKGDVGAVLVLLDGDVKVGGDELCAASVGREMARMAKDVGAGSTFSVAVVFALQEFESWLIASYESIGGNVMPDGRKIPNEIDLPENIEENPRNAKGWWKKCIGKYKPTMDQAILTRWLEPSHVRDKGLRSFHRLDSALSEVVEAIKTGNHVSTPSE